MPTDILQEKRTAITWKPSGGDRVLTLTNMSNNVGRKGAAYNFGTSYAQKVAITLLTKFQATPTSGNLVEVYLAYSPDGTTFDGGLADADAAASDTDIHRQLEHVGSMVVDNSTVAQQITFEHRLLLPNCFPVVFNTSGAAMTNTAGDHVLTIAPIGDEVQ